MHNFKSIIVDIAKVHVISRCVGVIRNRTSHKERIKPHRAFEGCSQKLKWYNPVESCDWKLIWLKFFDWIFWLNFFDEIQLGVICYREQPYPINLISLECTRVCWLWSRDSRTYRRGHLPLKGSFSSGSVTLKILSTKIIRMNNLFIVSHSFVITRFIIFRFSWT